MSLCDCNGRRIPTKFKVTISGATNNVCSACSGINGDYYPEREGTSCTSFKVTVAGGSCGLSELRVTVEDALGSYLVTVGLQTTNGSTVYEQGGVPRFARGANDPQFTLRRRGHRL